MTEGFELDCAQDFAAIEDQQRLYYEERAALRRIAEGLGSLDDAALLARSLNHSDLFRGQHEPIR